MARPDVLSQTCAFLARFVAYPSEDARIAHGLWILHTHLMDEWDSTPRIAFLSPEPGSGKSRALEVTELLVPNPISIVNTSPSYLFHKVADTNRPTILFDEADTYWGPTASGDDKDIQGLVNTGHRKGTVTGRMMAKGRNHVPVEYPAYSAVAIAGLKSLPDTILHRSIIVRMRRRAPTEFVEPFRERLHGADGRKLRTKIAKWAAEHAPTVREALPTVHERLPAEITDRTADVWESLIVIADELGGQWPDRARKAAVALIKEFEASGEQSLNLRLLADCRICFNGHPAISSQQLVQALVAMEDAPWSDMWGGKTLTARGLAARLGAYDIRSKNVRFGPDTQVKGYEAEQFEDAWTRYLGPPDPDAPASPVVTPDEVQGSLDDLDEPEWEPPADDDEHPVF